MNSINSGTRPLSASFSTPPSEETKRSLRDRNSVKTDEQSRMGASSVRQVEPQIHLPQADNNSSHASLSFLSRAVANFTSSVSWLLENRLGVAKRVGQELLPSQILPWWTGNFPPEGADFPDLSETHKLAETLSQARAADSRRPRLTVPVTLGSGSIKLKGAICYPPGWNPEDKSSCIVFHNPNATVLSRMLLPGGNLEPGLAPGKLQSAENCPVLLYDYRGTGLNEEALRGATYETVVQDGQTAIECALANYDFVTVVGTSLGGGVATVALARHLAAEENQGDITRVKLVSHDSFTTTSRVVRPDIPRLADWVGWLVGGHIDAEAAMRELLDKDVGIIVLNQADDLVIPLGARMSELIGPFQDHPNVFCREFQQGHHGYLSQDMVAYLDEANEHFRHSRP
ncbi:alpha/beta hydrolase [Endozoicomonas sp. ONNA2]|uniref:alpha/beta hydrolase n=1 Tax=Endozoicomonas sp. ONNA2 TaxID=2828741 RepID=UPI00214855F2|nr:alpha/beta hydrolase [Endozoicomonas sp. ONNA2]